MRNIAFILAGGIGSRVGGDTPKQLLPLADGRSILDPDWMDEAQKMIERNSWRKVTNLIPGGKERWESSWNAISLYLKDNKPDPDTFFWFHDAARPYVSQEIIHNVGEAVKNHLAVTVAIPVTDTLYHVQDGNVQSIKSRREYMRAQTPQAFHYAVIGPAYMRAIEKRNIQATDDVGILLAYNPEVPVYIVRGDDANRKITFKEDL